MTRTSSKPRADPRHRPESPEYVCAGVLSRTRFRPAEKGVCYLRITLTATRRYIQLKTSPWPAGSCALATGHARTFTLGNNRPHHAHRHPRLRSHSSTFFTFLLLLLLLRLRRILLLLGLLLSSQAPDPTTPLPTSLLAVQPFGMKFPKQSRRWPLPRP